jgi:phosphatidylglycerophosphate synthase
MICRSVGYFFYKTNSGHISVVSHLKLVIYLILLFIVMTLHFLKELSIPYQLVLGTRSKEDHIRIRAANEQELHTFTEFIYISFALWPINASRFLIKSFYAVKSFSLFLLYVVMYLLYNSNTNIPTCVRSSITSHVIRFTILAPK